MKPKRCIILIDGSNFYFKLKNYQLHNLLQFNFSLFAKTLAKKCKIVECRYYVGAVKTDGTEKTQKIFNSQRKLLSHLTKNKFKYSLGFLLKSNNRFHEKGVDVNIAVDILVASYENLCDNIILISSDTDLLPAIKKAKNLGKTIEYVGFSTSPSLAMIANCSDCTLLKKEDLETFLKL